MTDLVIFDCDGTLVDSERIAVRVEVEMLAELGWPLTEDEVITRFVGRSHQHFRAAVEEQLGVALEEGWDLPYRQRYHDAYERELAMVDGVAHALELIHVPTCVASNSTHDHITRVLTLTGLWERFNGRVFSVEDVERGKPAPDLFLHAAETMSVAPERCIVVEDSPAGVEAAQAAGMRVLAYEGTLVPRHLFPADTEWYPHMAHLPELLASGG